MKQRASSSVTVSSQTSDEEIDLAAWVRRYVAALFALDAEEQAIPTQQVS